MVAAATGCAAFVLFDGLQDSQRFHPMFKLYWALLGYGLGSAGLMVAAINLKRFFLMPVLHQYPLRVQLFRGAGVLFVLLVAMVLYAAFSK
jgi:hypothetical protein